MTSISHPTPKFLETYASFKNSYDSVNRKIAKGADKDQLFELIKKVVDKATLIEESQAEILKESKFLGLSPRTWKWINRGISGFTVFSITITSGSSILTSRYQNEANCDVPDVVIGFSTTAAALAFGSAIASWIYSSLNEKKIEQFEPTERNLGNVSAIKLFLIAFLDFMQSAKEENKHTLDSSYSECIGKLKQNSLELSKVARDRWVSAIIQTLPDESPLKSLFIQQKDLAERKLSLQNELESKRILKMEEQTSSPFLERRASAVDEEEKELPYSFSEGEPNYNDSSSYLHDKTTTRLQPSELHSSISEETTEIDDIKHELHQIKIQFANNYQKLQELIDLDIKECNLCGLWFKDTGEISKKPFESSDSFIDIKTE